MKRLLISLLILAINVAIIPEFMAADNIPTVPETVDDDYITLENTKNPSGRPKIPGRQIITCHYDGENLNLDFIYPEGECEVYLTDISTNLSRYYLIDSAELSTSIFVGTIKSTAITLTTSHGNTYTGTITVE